MITYMLSGLIHGMRQLRADIERENAHHGGSGA